MQREKQLMALFGALAIALAAGALFFFYVQDQETVPANRVEVPYQRTEDLPPSAVVDETSHPALAGGQNTANGTDIPPRDKHLPPRSSE